MFVDEITITAKAGNGGDGVVRWRREKFIPKGGPAGGNGGSGGDVYIRAVRDVGLLSKYTGAKDFEAQDGNAGEKKGKSGKDGDDIYIEVPVGATVTEKERGRVYTCMTEGETHRVLKGGRGGLGNEYFKSSINRAPEESTKGRKGEHGTFNIELSLIVDIGIIGLPNAGKSTLLNSLTNAHSRVGSYPFTTLEPHLGELYGYILADIPGLIEGASHGKGLGHKFLKHVARTNMLLHCISLENEDPVQAHTTVCAELKAHDQTLLEKEEWVVLTKSDLVSIDYVSAVVNSFVSRGVMTYVVSCELGSGIKELSDALVSHLRVKNVVS